MNFFVHSTWPKFEYGLHHTNTFFFVLYSPSPDLNKIKVKKSFRFKSAPVWPTFLFAIYEGYWSPQLTSPLCNHNRFIETKF